MSDPQSEFLQNLVASGLMTEGQVTAFVQRLPDESTKSDPKSLATEFVRAKQLTKYQAAAIFQGKTKGLVFGEYTVLERIGAGGMGVVLKAEHKLMKRKVAVKVLPSHVLKDNDTVKRFYKEAEAAGRLMHNNIVTAHDVGEQDGMHYLVMEFVDGPDLAGLLERRLRCPIIWVSGPPGSGKTTLVVDYIEKHSVKCLWHEVKHGDGGEMGGSP